MTATLSPREMEVARLVAKDLSDKDIAGLLGISERTVQAYLDRITKKFDLSGMSVTRRRAIARACR